MKIQIFGVDKKTLRPALEQFGGKIRIVAHKHYNGTWHCDLYCKDSLIIKISHYWPGKKNGNQYQINWDDVLY